MNYGIEKVVGGFGQIREDEILPYAIARTVIEHQQLREFMGLYSTKSLVWIAAEFGCGYGRMLPVLQQRAGKVFGIERDFRLSAIAKKLNPQAVIKVPDNGAWHDIVQCVDLALTFTFLQHLDKNELHIVTSEIKRSLKPGGLAIIVEQTNEDIGENMTGRTVEEYKEIFSGFTLLGSQPRRLEPTSPHKDGGSYMAFLKP